MLHWGVRVAADSLHRITELGLRTNLSPGQILGLAFESLACGEPSELRSYVARHAGEPFAPGRVLTWKAWRFSVRAVTVAHAEVVAKEFNVAKQVLVTLVIDCLTQGGGDGGGRRAKAPGTLGELLRIIYSSAPSHALAAAGGLSSAEVVATSTA